MIKELRRRAILDRVRVKSGGFPIDGLVSYYKLDETTGSVIDSIGGNNGTNNGMTRGVSGKLGNCYKGNGTGWVNLNWKGEQAGGLYCESNRQFSLSFWLNHFSSTDVGQYISRATNTSADRTFHFAYNAGRFSIFARGALSDYLNIPINQWVFITVTWNGTAAILYVNGLFSQLLNVGIAPENINQNINIASRTDGLFILQNGLIDDVGFWDKPLNQTEITQLYNNGNGITL